MVGSESLAHTECDQHSYHRRGKSNTLGAHAVWLQTYYMDTTEVTNAAYRACVALGKCAKAGPRYADFKRATQPVTGVSFFDAEAFCEAHGKHLPTEAEWEVAAQGPEGELHPWGSAASDCTHAVVRDPHQGRSCGVKKLGGSPRKGRVLAVASRPPGRFGLYDMIGNAEEWTADWYTHDWHACGVACRGVNPRGPCAGQTRCKGLPFKTVRGGSWYWSGTHATSIHRRPHKPSNRPFHHFGFRCAASFEEAERLTSPKGRAR